MNEKVILISIDGMRPDGVIACGHPFFTELKEMSSYTLAGSSVIPPVTLPCHTTMFYGIPPQRHGTLTNSYTPPVRPVKGLAEQLCAAGKKCAAFHNWESIRHIWQSETMQYTSYINAYEEENTDEILTEQVLNLIARKAPDFVFLHLVETDEKGGHDHGWMTPKYLDQLRNALTCAQRIYQAAGQDYHIIITADHGGHDRTHGLDCPEDMTIPMFYYGKFFVRGKKLPESSLLDLAPTIAWLTGVPASREWEGNVISHL